MSTDPVRRWLVIAGCVALGVLALALWLRPASGPVPAAPARPAATGSASAAPASPADPPPAASPPGAAALDGIPHTELPLRLLATVVREDPTRSLAAVEDEEHAEHQVLTEGQTFEHHPQATLARIERSRILIDNDGVREQLVFDRTAAVPAPESGAFEPSSAEIERRRDLSRRLRELTEAGPDWRGRDERGGILAEGDVAPVYDERGELVGVELDAIREGGLYDRVGLRDGDVVTSINDVSLGSATAAAELLTEIALSDVLELEVRHPDGSSSVLPLDTRELVEGFPDIP